MIKLIITITKKLLFFSLILWCIYLIFITLEDLNDLIFHSYKTSRVFGDIHSKSFFDLDLIVKYSDHFWDIIAKSLVVWCLLFGAVIPYFIKIFSAIKTHFTGKTQR